LLLIAGGTQVTPQLALVNGMDEGFGRKTKGQNVATFLVKHRKEGNG
jgi:D-ornithine 4,5-aminomutase subunit beta